VVVERCPVRLGGVGLRQEAFLVYGLPTLTASPQDSHPLFRQSRCLFKFSTLCRNPSKFACPMRSAKSEFRDYSNVSWCVLALGFVISWLIILSCLITPVVLTLILAVLENSENDPCKVQRQGSISESRYSPRPLWSSFTEDCEAAACCSFSSSRGHLAQIVHTSVTPLASSHINP
jgi:hypothetical protein